MAQGGVHISPYALAHGYDRHEPDRERKLLAHRHQLDAWRDRTEREQLTLVPLSLYFKEGRAKAEIALVRGRRSHDKRQAVAKRDARAGDRPHPGGGPARGLSRYPGQAP